MTDTSNVFTLNTATARNIETGLNARLKNGGGGGTFDGMEAKVARLEEDMTGVRSDLRSLRDAVGEVRITLARIETDLKHKIDYKWITLYFLGIVAVILREEVASLFR